MSKKEGILSVIGLVFVMILFGCALTWEEEPTRQPEKDEVTGSVVWAVTSTPTQRASFTPTCTNTPTPEPTATPEPTPTNTPAPTNTPTPKATGGTGVPGTYECEVNGAHGWKPLAWFTACNDKSAPQWRLQQIAKTAENGVRIVQDPNGEWRYCVALPVYWAGEKSEDIGRCFNIYMENGAVLKCVLGDTKRKWKSLNGEGKWGSKGELIEVQCDVSKLPIMARLQGDASYINDDWAGEARKIVVLDMFIEGFGG